MTPICPELGRPEDAALVEDVLNPGPPQHMMLCRAVARLARTWTWRAGNQRLHHVLSKSPTVDEPTEDLWTPYRLGVATGFRDEIDFAGLTRRQAAAFKRGQHHRAQYGPCKTTILPADEPVFVKQVLRGKYEDLRRRKGWASATHSIKDMLSNHFAECAWEQVVAGYIAGWTQAPITIKGQRSRILLGCAFGHQARLDYDKMQVA